MYGSPYAYGNTELRNLAMEQEMYSFEIFSKLIKRLEEETSDGNVYWKRYDSNRFHASLDDVDVWMSKDRISVTITLDQSDKHLSMRCEQQHPYYMNMCALYKVIQKSYGDEIDDVMMRVIRYLNRQSKEL